MELFLSIVNKLLWRLKFLFNAIMLIYNSNFLIVTMKTKIMIFLTLKSKTIYYLKFVKLNNLELLMNFLKNSSHYDF